MKALGLILMAGGILFFLYWNFAVAGEVVHQGDWRYAYNELPGSSFYPLIAIFIGSALMKASSPGEGE